MPMGALLVAQRLAGLKADVSQRFGGLVVHIKASLDLVGALSPEDAAAVRSAAVHGLREARRQAEAFVRTLRAILSDLRRIRKAILAAPDMRDKMETYFEQFIGELLLKDFQSIMTFNHPYRFRDGIIATARAASMDPKRMGAVAVGYVEAGLAPDPAAARDAAADDLLAIEGTFESIGAMFERIAQFRRALEGRLRNTVKYAEGGERGLGTRARDLVRRLEALLAAPFPGQPERYDRPTVPAAVEPIRTPWSEASLAPPRQGRTPMVAKPLPARPTDPEYLFRKRLRAEYLARVAPTPQQVRAFLDAMVPPHGAREARSMPIRDVDELLAFDAVRRYALTRDVPAAVASAFRIEPLPGGEPHDSDWLRCDNFSVRRL